jgi:pyridoxine 5-phosphate synthase
MTKLSVNINKIAVLRNSRGGNLPDLFKVARDCEAFGAQGITVHPRPDERHIRYSDLEPLKGLVTTEFNIEGYPDNRFMDSVLSIKPHQCTLVPDPPGVLTSSSGWDTIEQRGFLQEIVGQLKEAGIRVSLFVDPVAAMIDGAALCGTDRIELYTGDYASEYVHDRDLALAPHIAAAEVAASLGLGLNAGHDLNLDNLADFKQHVPGLLEVSIGHALISDALYYGLHNTIQMYLLRLESRN